MLLLNNQPINYFVFSGGEFQVKLPHKIDSERAILTWKPIDASEITLLLLSINALKYMGFHDIDLDILYLPYARQDRVCSTGEAHSLEVMCHLLDSLGLTTIRMWDVHNETATAELFDDTHVVFITAKDIFSRYQAFEEIDTSKLILCAPDDGAYQRVLEVVNHHTLGIPVVMQKIRDPNTGKITGMTSNKHNRSVEGWNILVIDDICDGGATFIEVAEILKAQEAVNLFLYVTHGIFSNGLNALYEHYKHIICHHVLHDDKYQSTDRLTILQEHKYVP